MIGLTPLGQHYLKLPGTIIAGLAAACILLYAAADIVLLPAMQGKGYGSLLMLVMIFGLYISATAREKREDERVKQIRGRAIYASFVLIMGTMIAYGTVILISHNIHEGIPLSAFLIPPAFALIVYHVLFYIGIYRDNLWDYNDEATMPAPATKKDRRLTYLVILALLILLSFVTMFIKSGK